MISKDQTRKYCCEDISLIENYDKAVNDKTQQWDCHHRAEILPCGRFSTSDLKKHGLYWNVPASQLVFLTKSDHRSLHANNMSEATRKKMSNTRRGVKRSIDVVKKIADSNRGKRRSLEQRQRMSEACKGRTLSAEHRQRLLEVNVGSHRSEETRRKISEARKRYWERKRVAI